MSRVVKSAFSFADKVAKVSPSASAATRARTRALVLWTALAVPLGVFLIFATQVKTLLSPTSIGIYVGCIGMALSIFRLRRSQRLNEASLIFASSVLVGLGMSAWMVDVPGLLPLIFLAVTPVYFGLMVNWQKCLTYTAGLAVFFFALAIWLFLHQSAPPALITNIVGCGFAVVGVGVSTTAYSYTTERAVRKLKRQNDEIVELAYKDAMTGILNRRAFNERIHNRVIARPSEVLFAIDLDSFKAINDRHGHEVGDEVLVELARRVKLAVPDAADVFRVGGDEFAVMIEQTDVSVASIARAICATSDDRYATSAGPLAVKISVGLTRADDTSLTLKHLYRQADIALFEAKKSKDTEWCIYSDELGAAKNREARLSELLKRAIRTSAIDVAFQPQFNISDRQVTGFEALARWHTVDFGTISPSEFVPIADKTGLIMDMDRCVLKQAVFAAQAWLPQSQKLAVNVSGKTLLSHGFVAYVEQTVSQSALTFDQFTIEITETEIIDNKAEAKIVCDQLRALGIAIALDDFGTGYSSLSYLSTLPINTLKLDRSFVQSAREQSNIKIMKSIIGLANSMGLNLLVEGVERSWQLETVVELGCESVQGFYFSRPLTSEQCAALLSMPQTAPTEESAPLVLESVEAGA